MAVSARCRELEGDRPQQGAGVSSLARGPTWLPGVPGPGDHQQWELTPDPGRVWTEGRRSGRHPSVYIITDI